MVVILCGGTMQHLLGSPFKGELCVLLAEVRTTLMQVQMTGCNRNQLQCTSDQS